MKFFFHTLLVVSIALASLASAKQYGSNTNSWLIQTLKLQSPSSIPNVPGFVAQQPFFVPETPPNFSAMPSLQTPADQKKPFVFGGVTLPADANIGKPFGGFKKDQDQQKQQQQLFGSNLNSQSSSQFHASQPQQFFQQPQPQQQFFQQPQNQNQFFVQPQQPSSQQFNTQPQPQNFGANSNSIPITMQAFPNFGAGIPQQQEIFNQVKQNQFFSQQPPQFDFGGSVPRIGATQSVNPSSKAMKFSN